MSDLEKAVQETVVMAVCPATRENIRLFREVCLDWQEVPECLGAGCHMYPHATRTPVVTLDLPRRGKQEKVSVDIEQGVARVGEQEIALSGSTFAMKIKSLREKLSGILDEEEVRKVINQLTGSRKAASVPAIKKGAVLWLKTSAHVVEGKGQMLWGVVREIRKDSRDNSEAIVIEDGSRVGWLFDRKAVFYLESEAVSE